MHYFWVDGSTNIAAAILLMFVLNKPKKLKTDISKTKEENLFIASSAYKDKEYLVFIALTILYAFCFFQIFTLLPVFYKTQLHISENEIGMLMAVNGLIIAFVEMFLVYNLERKNKPMKFISYGVWLVAISYVLFNLLQGRFMLALFSILIVTLGEMLSMPFMNTYWISRSSESNRGQYAALYSMSWATSQIAAPSIGGWIANQYSFNVLFWVLFVTAGLTAVGYNFLMNRVIINKREGIIE